MHLSTSTRGTLIGTHLPLFTGTGQSVHSKAVDKTGRGHEITTKTAAEVLARGRDLRDLAALLASHEAMAASTFDEQGRRARGRARARRRLRRAHARRRTMPVDGLQVVARLLDERSRSAAAEFATSRCMWTAKYARPARRMQSRINSLPAARGD